MRTVAPDSQAFTADTNTALLPCALALPTVGIPCCCQNCDGLQEGTGDGCGAMVMLCCCWYSHVGEWTGVYDLTSNVTFELSAQHGLVVETKESRRSFKLEGIEALGVFSSSCEHILVPSQLADEQGAVACSSGAVLVQVFSNPRSVPSAAEARRGLPSVVDCCTDPLLNAHAKALCLNQMCCCGTCSPSESPNLKTVNCAFLGAVVKGVGVVRLSRKAWRSASVAKLAAVAAAIHERFPQLKPDNSQAAPAPLKMDGNDRMSERPPEGGIRGTAGPMGYIGAGG